jgi:HD domain
VVPKKTSDVTGETRAFKTYAAVIGLSALIPLCWLARVETISGKQVPALVLFSALVVYSNHRAVEFANGSIVNADFMIMMAAIVAFSGTSPMLAPAVVALARGLYLPHLRARSWALISLNCASGILGVIAGAAALQLFPAPNSASILVAIGAALVAATACVVTLWLALAPAFVLRNQSFRSVVGTFAPRAVESLPFSLVGFFVGLLYLRTDPSVGVVLVLMLIVPMFIAREMFASYLKVKEAHNETVHMLIRALEAKDRYTAGHAERVAMYAEYIGEQMQFMPARMERLRFAALMHDIGKLVVPNHILNKPGKLTEEEFRLIKQHEKVSVQMLSNIEFLRPIAGAGHSDNTRFDPDDPTHPIEPYIVMIADAYDAMTSTRAYRKALPQEVAFQELRDKAGIQFHPACVEALIAALEARGEKHGAGYEVEAEFEDAPEAGLGSAGLGDLLPAEA